MMPLARRSADTDAQLTLAREIAALSLQQRETVGAVLLIGRHHRLECALQRAARFAASSSPVLISGETGTGKELFARGLFLLSQHHRRTFVRVNCAQYCSEQMVASELFGHRRGSFTGAIADHTGLFEAGNGGTVFLDEIAELPLPAQAMLLRALGEGEVVAVGDTRARRVDVRILAATSHDLEERVCLGRFREDLYFRLQQLHLRIPALRERGEDWRLIAEYFLERLCEQCSAEKTLSEAAIAALSTYSWPGNVREVRSCVETGYHMSEGSSILPGDFGEILEATSRRAEFRRIPFGEADTLCQRMLSGGESFWSAVHDPFLARELNRAQVCAVVAEGLRLSGGSYKRLLGLFGIREDDYLRFMDFLRHHRLKPQR